MFSGLGSNCRRLYKFSKSFSIPQRKPASCAMRDCKCHSREPVNRLLTYNSILMETIRPRAALAGTFVIKEWHGQMAA